MTAYYNEIDPYAAAWLRNLIAAGHIADGVVDERSIVDVQPEDLAGFTQVHFFAGLGGWSHAARLAGWPDDRPLWTGSCPCQPFSVAGKGAGTADERHLWPEMHRLVAALRPPVVVGEQVASRAGLDWLDAVCADLEGAGYATGAIDLCAASVGAPHIRQRLWWVAYADNQLKHGRRDAGAGRRDESSDRGINGGLAYAQHDGQREHRHGLGSAARGYESEAPERQRLRLDPADGGAACRVAYAPGEGPQGSGSGWGPRPGREGGAAERGGEAGWTADADQGERRRFADGEGRQPDWSQAGWQQGDGEPQPSGEVGFWSRADWIPCRDGKARPVEPGSFPLVDRATARVGRLRAYGYAIVPQVAAEVLIATSELIANRLQPVANGGTDGL